MLSVASVSFLIAITRREQVAQIFGKPIYVVTDVALLPLSSPIEAGKGIVAAVRQRETMADADEDSSDAESTLEDSQEGHSAEDAHEEPSPADDVRLKAGKDDGTAGTNIAVDVFTRRGPYGKFASQWFTKKGWGVPGVRTPSKTEGVAAEPSQKANAASPSEPPATSMKDAITSPPTEGASSEKAAGPISSAEPTSQTPTSEKNATTPLLPKLLQSTRLILSSRSFYFSYDFNITKRLGDPPMLRPKSLVHEDIDPLVCTTCTILSSTCSLLTAKVFLESKFRLFIHQCGFLSVLDADHARICWSAAFHS